LGCSSVLAAVEKRGEFPTELAYNFIVIAEKGIDLG